MICVQCLSSCGRWHCDVTPYVLVDLPDNIMPQHRRRRPLLRAFGLRKEHMEKRLDQKYRTDQKWKWTGWDELVGRIDMRNGRRMLVEWLEDRRPGGAYCRTAADWKGRSLWTYSQQSYVSLTQFCKVRRGEPTSSVPDCC
jgi:hypothetical protein